MRRHLARALLGALCLASAATPIGATVYTFALSATVDGIANAKPGNAVQIGDAYSIRFDFDSSTLSYVTEGTSSTRYYEGIRLTNALVTVGGTTYDKPGRYLIERLSVADNYADIVTELPIADFFDFQSFDLADPSAFPSLDFRAAGGVDAIPGPGPDQAIDFGRFRTLLAASSQVDGSFLTLSNVQASIAAAVPETRSWIMMIMGFGGIGTAMRRRQKAAVTLG